MSSPTRVAQDRFLGRDPTMIGEHPVMHRLRSEIVRAARLDSPVLLEGPTGSGKEVAVELLHARSTRTGRLVPINVAALSEHLVEAELFGSVRGAFTGALSDRKGLIEEAEGGTLFLDEAAELTSSMQAKLLRVLEGGMVRRVGASSDRRVHFHLVLSTQQPAVSLVAAGQWRADFYYRVASIRIRVPALADHISDLPLLINYFLELLGRPPLRFRRSLQILADYRWPGNIREVRRLVERAAFLAGDEVVSESLLAQCLAAGNIEHRPRTELGQNGRALRDVERDHIEAVLRDSCYDVVAAAKVLGLSPRSLYRRFHLLGILPPRRRADLTIASIDQ